MPHSAPDIVRARAGGERTAACRQIEGTLSAAKRTLELMRELLGIHKHEDHLSLIDHVREVGIRMISARPQGAPLPLYTCYTVQHAASAGAVHGSLGL